MSEDFFDKNNYFNENGGNSRDGSYQRRENHYNNGFSNRNFGKDHNGTQASRKFRDNRFNGAPHYGFQNQRNEERPYSRNDRRQSYQTGARFGNNHSYENNRPYTSGRHSQNGFHSPNSENAFGEQSHRRPSYTSDNRYSERPQRTFRPQLNNNRENDGASRFDNRNRPYGTDENTARPRFRNNYNPHAKYSHKKQLVYKEEHYDPNQPVRLNKFLANAGVCSRRDADKFIAAGVVTVNGNVVTEMGAKVLRSDVVSFHNSPIKMEKKVYVLLNKPKGYVTTSEDPQNRKIVMDLVKNACRERIYPVGRLDRNTTGVLLLTNDGELAAKLTHPKFLKKKIYHVYTDRSVTAADMRQIADGITLEDGEIKADNIEYASDTDKKQVGIEIHSGRNRIVRRIFEHFGYHVEKLDRVYFAGLTKKNVKRGDWRYLTEKEVNMLRMGAFE